MDKWQGLQAFWESFGLTAYDENTVPDNATLPYITYEAAIGAFGDNVPLSASVWYYGTSWTDVSKKVDEISSALNGWKLIKLADRQYIYLHKNRDGLFAQRMPDVNTMIRRVRISLSAEYFTAD